MVAERALGTPTFVGISGGLVSLPVAVRRRRCWRCTFGNGRPRGPNFQPGARGLFWSAHGPSSPGSSGAPGPDGGPCDLFGFFGGLESAGGMSGGGPEGGDLSNPNSFSFFSAGVEYGQRRLCAETPELDTNFGSDGSFAHSPQRRISLFHVSAFTPPSTSVAGSSAALHEQIESFASRGVSHGAGSSPATLSEVVDYSPSRSRHCVTASGRGPGSASEPSSTSAPAGSIPGTTSGSSAPSAPSRLSAPPERKRDPVDQGRPSPPTSKRTSDLESIQSGEVVTPTPLPSAPTRANLQDEGDSTSAGTGLGPTTPRVSTSPVSSKLKGSLPPSLAPRGRSPQKEKKEQQKQQQQEQQQQQQQQQQRQQQQERAFPGQVRQQHRQLSPTKGGKTGRPGSGGVGGGAGGNGSNTSQGHQVSGKVRRQVRSLFERAKEEERSGSIDETRRLLRQCLSLDRRDAHSWLALARLEARCGGVSLRPNSSPGSPASPLTGAVVMGAAEADVSESKKQNTGAQLARRLFEEGVSECPTSVHLLQAWAVLEHRCGDREAARKLFARGLELEPDNPYVCQAWGLLEQRGGNTEAARDLFSRSVNLRPHPEVCAAWAVLEAREGNVARARELFQCGLKACKSAESPSAAAIYRSWAEIEERVGDLVGARELLAKAISSQPRVAEAYVALSRLEARRGQSTRALELMQTAASLSKKPPAVVFNAWAQIEWTSCGRVEAARQILERGHNLHPNDPALLQTLGTLEERCGNIAKAKELYAASIRVRPTAPAFVAWALVEEREGDVMEAVNLFEQALMTDALHGAAYNAYGMMEARRGELDRARAVYERGLKVFASASVYHGYGQLELKLGRNPDRARELFQCGVAQTREDTAFIWHSWGMLELGLRNATAARRVFLDALARYPRNSRVLVGAALAHSTSFPGVMADEATAREYFKRAVGADPSHAHAWQAWGVFELRRGRKDAAEALFRRGLRMCPLHGALWQAWGVLETTNGNFERARQLFKRGSAACPSHVHLYQAWACMEVRTGNIDRARELLDHALESDPCHGPVWAAYGLLEARHGTLAKARQHFVTGVTRAPNHAPLYRTYGQAEARAGNYHRARELFREGLRRDPRHAPLYHAMAEFEAMVGNIEAIHVLNGEAQMYFGSEADASAAIHSGEESLSPDVAATSDDGIEYSSKSTPMELALDNM